MTPLIFRLSALTALSQGRPIIAQLQQLKEGFGTDVMALCAESLAC